MTEQRKVWLILPLEDTDLDDWLPASVFATWELAVARVRENTEPDEVQITEQTADSVECVAEEVVFRIVALPVEED